MAFRFYQCLRTTPGELKEAGRMFGLSGWTRFWRIDAPFAGPTSIALPGISSYIATAIAGVFAGLIRSKLTVSRALRGHADRAPREAPSGSKSASSVPALGADPACRCAD